MKINRSSRFKRSFKKLPPKIKDDFDRKIKIFFKDPFTLSLRTHKLKGNLADYYAFNLKRGLGKIAHSRLVGGFCLMGGGYGENLWLFKIFWHVRKNFNT